MANRLFQSIIHQMKDAVDRVIGVIDETGTVIACSDLVRIGEQKADFAQHPVFSDSADVFFHGGYTYRLLDPSNSEYTVFAEGEDKTSEMIARMVSVSLLNMKNLHDDKYDRASFIKNIILDNILPSDIFIKSKELNFNTAENRVVLLIKFQDKTEFLPFEMLQNMFPDRQRDYIITLGEYEVALVMEVRPGTDNKEIEAIAARIIDTLVTEFYVNASIGISTVVDNIKDLGNAYKEAQVALDVGKVFESEKRYISYCNLGIGRLIYQLPVTLCEMYLHEVFRSGSIEALDEDTLETIECFFENNLNVSETSRKLYIHRNTLVYRIEKIRKLTGLDLREFDNAITFRVALMVRQYLSTKYIPGKAKRPR
ncbi:MAG: helix-turn-helix domain-containing protein [Clostridia bacterium]|nr:helix-turn-helix domain-containing protein [Clostridia bacterium]MBP5174083.1 helix-turn-helix domain-containing protein [Clostridia bacterium]